MFDEIKISKFEHSRLKKKNYRIDLNEASIKELEAKFLQNVILTILFPPIYFDKDKEKKFCAFFS